jgi:hypothetical protein
MTDRRKEAREAFDESHRSFQEAHAEGMRNLRSGDLNALGLAIKKERTALDKVADAITLASAPTDAREQGAGPQIESTTEARESIDAEHARLLEQMKALEADHRKLEATPEDIEGHRHHRRRLEAQIIALREHIERLRSERDP